MTIKEALAAGSRILAEAQIRTVEQDVRLLLQAVTGLTLAQMVAHPETALLPEQEEKFSQFIKLRARFYPIQYLIGEQEFFGRSFLVTPDVLIPRPETELLVERALELAGSLEQDVIRIIDVGTGSGCVSVSLALEERRAQLTAIDISEAALEVARSNAARHGCLERIQFLAGDALSPVREQAGPYAMVVSNPPYVSLGSEQVEASVAMYEPPEAVFAGPSGMEIYLKIFDQAPAVLQSGGFLVLELGYGILSDVRDAARQRGWRLDSVKQDLAGIDRCVVFSRP